MQRLGRIGDTALRSAYTNEIISCLEELVLQSKYSATCWSFDLSTEQEQLLRNCLGEEVELTAWSGSHIPSLKDMEDIGPCALWVSSHGLRTLLSTARGLHRHLDLLPKVLLLGEDYSLTDYESASDNGIAEVVRPPLTSKRTREIMRRVLEAQTIHNDMLCMTREITLERELLERKNEILAFLVNFLTTTSGSLDLNHILQTTFNGLNALFPVHTLHVALWQETQNSEEPTPVSLHIAANENTESFYRWQEILLEQARILMGNRFAVEEKVQLALPEQQKKWQNARPQDGNVICFPITTGSEKVGVIAVLTEMDRNLGRDQALALESAIRNLALTVKNAHRFRMIQLHADFDSLTQVHSRRHLETRLEEEMDRFYRYKTPLSMVMLDIDFFKSINDSRGHRAGDIVLREVAAIISNTIRTSDYCARYGGEEFALLLPHTDEQKAFVLAERLRKRIAGHTFFVDGGPLTLTVSLGLSTLSANMHKSGQTLVCESDSALYKAKAGGRNQTCQTANGKAETLLHPAEVG